MQKAGVGAPLDLQDERSKGGHPLQVGRGKCSLVEGDVPGPFGVCPKPHVRISHQLSTLCTVLTILDICCKICMCLRLTSDRVVERVTRSSLILAIFGDHTVYVETAATEHVWVNGRSGGALCDFWNRSIVAPNRKCKIET